MDSLHQIRISVVRLERYCRRAKDKIRSGKSDDFFGAMAGVAEIHEIARRLYSLIQQHVSATSSHIPKVELKDEIP